MKLGKKVPSYKYQTTQYDGARTDTNQEIVVEHEEHD